MIIKLYFNIDKLGSRELLMWSHKPSTFFKKTDLVLQEQ